MNTTQLKLLAALLALVAGAVACTIVALLVRGVV